MSFLRKFRLCILWAASGLLIVSISGLYYGNEVYLWYLLALCSAVVASVIAFKYHDDSIELRSENTGLRSELARLAVLSQNLQNGPWYIKWSHDGATVVFGSVGIPSLFLPLVDETISYRDTQYVLCMSGSVMLATPELIAAYRNQQLEAKRGSRRT